MQPVMQPMPFIFFLISVCSYPFIKALLSSSLLNTNPTNPAFILLTVLLFSGFFLGGFLNHRMNSAPHKLLAWLIGNLFFLGALSIGTVRLHSVLPPEALWFSTGIALLLQGCLLSLPVTITPSWFKFLAIGILVGIVTDTHFLLDALGFLGIGLVIGIAYFLLGLLLWLIRTNVFLPRDEPTDEQHTASPAFWLTSAVIIQLLFAGFFSASKKISFIALNDLPIVHTIFFFTVVLTLSLGVAWHQKRHQRPPNGLEKIYLPIFLFGAFIFIVSACNGAIFEFTSHSTYSNTLRGYHGFILSNFFSCFLFNLPLIPAGVALSALRKLSWDRFTLSVLMGFSIGWIGFAYFLIPSLGLLKSLTLLSVLSFITSAMLYLKHHDITQKSRSHLWYALSLILVGGWVWYYKPHVTYSSTANRALYNQFSDWAKQATILFQKDGPVDSLTVLNDSATEKTVLLENGNIVSVWDPSERELSEVAAIVSPVLGAAYRPNLKKALVLGLKEGLLIDTLLKIPNIALVNTIEPNAEAIDWAQTAGPHALSLAKSAHTVYQNDYRDYLSHQPETYDAIFLNTSYFWKFNTYRFYTEEFYQLIKAHLTTDGVYIQTINTRQISPITFATLLKSIHSVFPYNKVYASTSEDLTLLSSPAPLGELQSDALLASPPIKETLKSIDIRSADDLKASLFLQEPEIALVFNGFSLGFKNDNIYRDHFPYLEQEIDQVIRYPATSNLFQLRWGVFPPLTILTAPMPSSQKAIHKNRFNIFLNQYANANAIYQYFSGKTKTPEKDLEESLTIINNNQEEYCKDVTFRHMWLGTYHDFMRQTLPYLGSEQMNAVNNTFKTNLCHKYYDGKPDIVLYWVNLYDAYIAQDYEKVLLAASHIYDPRKNTQYNQVALNFLLLSQVKLGKWEEAKKLWLNNAFTKDASYFSQILALEAMEHKEK